MRAKRDGRLLCGTGRSVNNRYIADWEERFARHEAWWARERMAGPLLWVTSPRQKPLTDSPAPAAPPLPGKYVDVDYICRERRWALDTTFFGGDAFPRADVMLGPGSLALYLGGEPGFADSTIWFKPCVEDLDSAALPVFNPGNKWFRFHLDLTRRVREALGGDAYVTIPDIIESLDILAAMRDPMALLYDLMDKPAACHRWLRRINDLYQPHYDAFYDLCRDDRDRSVFAAFALLGQGKVCKVQCDFSAMISPRTFGEFYVPYVKEQMEGLDRVVFHLDGPNCICHLDQLLALDKLNAINWVAGASAPPTGDPCWFPMFKKILDAGKGLHMGIRPDAIEGLLKAVGSRGVYLITSVASEREARELTAMTRRY